MIVIGVQICYNNGTIMKYYFEHSKEVKIRFTENICNIDAIYGDKK